jgi:hypothetical protein
MHTVAHKACFSSHSASPYLRVGHGGRSRFIDRATRYPLFSTCHARLNFETLSPGGTNFKVAIVFGSSLLLYIQSEDRRGELHDLRRRTLPRTELRDRLGQCTDLAWNGQARRDPTGAFGKRCPTTHGLKTSSRNLTPPSGNGGGSVWLEKTAWPYGRRFTWRRNHKLVGWGHQNDRPARG